MKSQQLRRQKTNDLTRLLEMRENHGATWSSDQPSCQLRSSFNFHIFSYVCSWLCAHDCSCSCIFSTRSHPVLDGQVVQSISLLQSWQVRRIETDHWKSMRNSWNLTNSRRNQQHEVTVQPGPRNSLRGSPTGFGQLHLRTLQHRLDQLQKEIIQCNRAARSHSCADRFRERAGPNNRCMEATHGLTCLTWLAVKKY